MKRKKANIGRNHAWVIPIILIAILTLSVGGYYAFSRIDQNRPLQTDPTGSAETTGTTAEPTTTEDSEIKAMRQALELDVFYQGIWIGDLNVSGLTVEKAKSELQKQDSAYQAAFGLKLTLDGKTWSLTAADAGLNSDWQAVLNQAWQIGRTGKAKDEAALIRERYAAVQNLKQTPARLAVSYTWAEDMIRQKIEAIAAEIDIEPVGAIATGFDLKARKFVIAEQVKGYKLEVDAGLAAVLQQLKAGKFSAAVALQAETVTTGMTAAKLGANLGKVSEAKTYASKPNPPRDNNISLICSMLNGLVLQPGETFSFNGRIGKRTAEKGFKEAGGIRDGILIPELGGGICQPNTTLCHAVLMADLQVDERNPHSWPSDYVPIGLDATVTWGGADFKFTNNTDYPLAIVSSYVKPAITFQIYGRLLEPGVSIKLTSEVTQNTPPGEPKITEVPTMEPGTTKEVRAAHNSIKAIGYKNWYKDGAFVKREVVFNSSYRPLPAIYEVGPVPTPGPPPEPTPGETTATTGETTATTSDTTATTTETTATTSDTTATTTETTASA